MKPGKAFKAASTVLRLRMTHIRMVSTHPINSVFELAQRKLQRKFSKRELQVSFVIYRDFFSLYKLCNILERFLPFH